MSGATPSLACVLRKKVETEAAGIGDHHVNKLLATTRLRVSHFGVPESGLFPYAESIGLQRAPENRDIRDLLTQFSLT